MHVDITLKNNGKLFTIKYDGVKFVKFRIWDNPSVEIFLKEDYTAESMNKFWYELNYSTTPYMHIYQANIVVDVHVSEV